MEFRQLHYFVALYEEGSVTRAARRLNVVQPAVSMQIGKLESELGQALFQRTPKGMVPTAAGDEAYRQFAPLLEDARAAKDRLAGFGGRIAGHLSVGAIASVVNNALSECLQRFCTDYPDVSLRVTGGYTADFVEMIEAGKLDIAIINQSRGRSRLPVQGLLREDLALVCTAGATADFAGPVPLETIAEMKLVLPSARHGLRTVVDDAFVKAGVHLRPKLEFDELKTIEEFVSGTNYFTLMPPVAIHRALDAGSLRSFATTPRITREIVCVYSPARGISPAAQRFVTQLRDCMATTVRFSRHHVTLFEKVDTDQTS